MAWWVRQPFAVPASHIGIVVQVLTALFWIQLPVDAPGKLMVGQIPGPLPIILGTLMEFLSIGVTLLQL